MLRARSYYFHLDESSCWKTMSWPKLRVGIVLGIDDEWTNECNLPPTCGKMHLRCLQISDISYWVSMNGRQFAAHRRQIAPLAFTSLGYPLT